jgi:isopentenyl diphosphate isomerase/L-lactate dehydrogenase-like FMN-dependent dehydrogenase
MVDKSDSSFSSYIEEYSEDSENDSFFYDTFVENEVLVDVDFGDNHTEIMGEITEISVNEAVASGGETAAGGEAAAGGGVAAGGEVQILANSKMPADV